MGISVSLSIIRRSVVVKVGSNNIGIGGLVTMSSGASLKCDGRLLSLTSCSLSFNCGRQFTMVGDQSAVNIGIDTTMSTYGSGEAYRHSSGTERNI